MNEGKCSTNRKRIPLEMGKREYGSQIMILHLIVVECPLVARCMPVPVPVPVVGPAFLYDMNHR